MDHLRNHFAVALDVGVGLLRAWWPRCAPQLQDLDPARARWGRHPQYPPHRGSDLPRVRIGAVARWGGALGLLCAQSSASSTPTMKSASARGGRNLGKGGGSRDGLDSRVSDGGCCEEGGSKSVRVRICAPLYMFNGYWALGWISTTVVHVLLKIYIICDVL